MAETRTINLEIKDNFKKVEKDIDDLNESLKETEKIVSKTSGVDKFTARLDELDAQIASGNLNTRQMNKLLQEYQTVAAQAGTQTPIGDRAIKSAAVLKDTLTDLQVRTKLLSSDYVKMDTTLAAIGTGAQAFSGIQSAMVLTGVESEELQKTMVKLQAVQGVSNSISAVTNALNKDAILGIQARIAIEKIQAVVIGTTTGAMKLLRIALVSTGLGALIVGIGLLIANFDKIVKAIQPVIDQFKKMADYLGLTDFAAEERAANEKKRYEAELKQIEKLQEAYEQKIIAQRQYFENVKKAYEISKAVAESEINLLESQGKSSIALRKEQALLEVQNAKKLLQQKQEAANVLGLNNAYAQRLGINKKLTQSEQDILAAKTALNTAEASLNKLNKEGSEKAKQASTRCKKFKKANTRRTNKRY
jgi:DNA repair exonuclease SbcCD ATPase subunit